jgi:NMD protein affecting ribosome stability and mRNA decay
MAAASVTPHKHTTITLHAIRQRAGVPYEMERRVCTSCSRVVAERALKRAAA